MSPPLGVADEQTLGAVLKQMLDRDERYAETSALVLQRLSDHSGSLQGLQMEVGRLVDLAKQQTSYNERQIQLAEQMAGSKERFDRIDAEFLKAASERAAQGSQIAEGRGALKMLTFLVGLGAPIVLAFAGFVYANLTDQIGELRETVRTLQLPTQVKP